jgi:1,4-dihydroxy-2-naphthoyl-CoA hydrolase
MNDALDSPSSRSAASAPTSADASGTALTDTCEQTSADASGEAASGAVPALDASAASVAPESDAPVGGPGSIDGVSGFMGMRWDDPQTVRLRIRPELINAGGLLSGVVTYALVDYCMGSTLWAQTTPEERIATIGISVNYVQTATEGEIVCSTTLDRRNRTTAVMRSEVRHEDGRLLVTAIGSYTIFTRRRAAAARPD